jgi:sterol desaturase/sphingolipid hydroxylase (fatty acid hydroxylase superfamily)/rhodanese-related sulfurtransferase
MELKKDIARSILRDSFLSVILYTLPVALMFFSLYLSGSRPWLDHHSAAAAGFRAPHFVEAIFTNLKTWGLPAILLALGVLEFSFGLYEGRWKKNERILDIVCFLGPKLLLRPVTVYFTLKLLPLALPGLASSYSWVPFSWACLIIAVADDLTQYWYHRLHHQVPWLWRFHRTHHSAPYMGMAMASRQNILYTVFFSQTYLLAALVYLGLGYAALFVTGIKSLITLGAHSSIPWDRPFYKYKVLHPVAWVMERLISTPATHQAHHADTDGDGVGHYKGNFGNMFFLWDVIFGTGIITRRYPKTFGIKQYKEEEWWVQFMWPFFKSRKKGSELAAGGPMVGDVEEERTKTGRLAPLGSFVILLLLSGAVHAQDAVSFARFKNNPIIGPALLQGADGEDINGPSLVRAPDWLPGRLGKYYLYFAHHKGKYIRLAYADNLEGPWKIYEPGTLQLKDCKVCESGLPRSGNSVRHDGAESSEDEVTHVASPDVLIDDARKELVLYFHCPIENDKYKGQFTLRAVSKDGIHFKADSTVLGYSYFRVFRWKGYYYSLSRAGLLARSKDGIEAFEKGPNPFAGIQDKTNYLRHAAVVLSGDTLSVFYSRIGDSPERILLSKIVLHDDWNSWIASKPVEIASPIEDYEGGNLPVTVSKPGLYYGKTRELRDPYVFRDGGRSFLLYAVAGESGIAIGELKGNEEFEALRVDSFHAKVGRQAAPQIIDVRTPEEFAINHLIGAISVDLRKEDHLKELSTLDKARPVFIYAIQNRRSGILAGELRKAGFLEVYELKSGIGSWIGAGYPYYSSVRPGVTLADYKKSISDGGLVLVDIGTKYCGLCRQVKGMIDSLKSQHDPAYKVVEIDLYNDPQLVAALGEVQAVPTVLLYKKDKIVWKRTGLSFTKNDIETEIEKVK